MSKSQGDNSQASVPSLKKIKLLGRNIEIKKLRLGEKIRVSRIYAILAKALKGDNWVKLEGGAAVPRKIDLNDFKIQDVLDTAPNFLHHIEIQYPEFLTLTTDLQDKEIQELDLPDLVSIGIACWNHNGFQTVMEDSLGKVLGDVSEEAPEESLESAESEKEPSKT